MSGLITNYNVKFIFNVPSLIKHWYIIYTFLH